MISHDHSHSRDTRMSLAQYVVSCFHLVFSMSTHMSHCFRAMQQSCSRHSMRYCVVLLLQSWSYATWFPFNFLKSFLNRAIFPPRSQICVFVLLPRSVLSCFPWFRFWAFPGLSRFCFLVLPSLVSSDVLPKPYCIMTRNPQGHVLALICSVSFWC